MPYQKFVKAICFDSIFTVVEPPKTAFSQLMPRVYSLRKEWSLLVKLVFLLDFAQQR